MGAAEGSQPLDLWGCRSQIRTAGLSRRRGNTIALPAAGKTRPVITQTPFSHSGMGFTISHRSPQLGLGSCFHSISLFCCLSRFLALSFHLYSLISSVVRIKYVSLPPVSLSVTAVKTGREQKTFTICVFRGLINKLHNHD